jgi:hypothetical protein
MMSRISGAGAFGSGNGIAFGESATADIAVHFEGTRTLIQGSCG